MLAKLNNSYTVNQVIVSVDDRNLYRNMKQFKGFNFYINNKSNVDLVDLKNNWSEWKKILSYKVERKKEQRDSFIATLALPSTAKNVMVEFLTNDNFRGIYDGINIICPQC